MTVKISYIFSTLLILSGLVSCVKVNTIDSRTIEDVSWVVVCKDVSETTKAASVLDTESSFATCVWKLNEGQTWAANRASAVIQNRGGISGLASGSQTSGTVSYDEPSGKWKIGGAKLYWPETGSFNFLSFTAANINDATPLYNINKLTSAQKQKIKTTAAAGLTVTGWNSDNDKTADLLVAEMQVDKKSSNSYLGMNGVATEFSHILSNVKFIFLKSAQPISYVDKKPDNTTITVNSISLKNYWYVGNFINGGSKNQEWTFNSASNANVKNNEIIYNTTKVLEEESGIEYGHLYIPQLLYDVKKNYGGGNYTETSLVINYSIKYLSNPAENKTATLTLPTTMSSNSWDPGKIYIYTIRIGANKAPIEFDASVGDWPTGDGLYNGGGIEI